MAEKKNGNGQVTRAEVQTSKWAGFIKRAHELGYVVDESNQSGYRLLQVVGNAGIGSVNDLNLDAVWSAIESHYMQKQPA